MEHNIFISWSGDLSRKVAAVLHEWLPGVTQAAEPFMSDKDIDAGARGLSVLANELKSLRIGLLCITPTNQDSPWLNFEAGCLAKLIERTYVIPMALRIDKGQIRNPLGQFQAKQFNKEDVWDTVKTINKALNDSLTEPRLNKAFERSWPDLETQIASLGAEQKQKPLIDVPKRTIEDMLDELIVLSRDQAAIIRHLYRRQPRITDPLISVATTENALRQLGEFYNSGKAMNILNLVATATKFDDIDWDIVENAPFLVWYLRHHHGIFRPPRIEGTAEGDIYDDTPF